MKHRSLIDLGLLEVRSSLNGGRAARRGLAALRRGCPPALLAAWLLNATSASAEPRAVGAVSGPPAAAGAARADSTPAARSELLLEQGMALRRLGKDEEALRAFEEAAALDPESTRVRVHLAATQQALGHWAEAETLLREVLQEPADPYVHRHRATLERALDFVARHLGGLLVAGQPVGAVVRVDGRSLGSLPLSEALRLPVGSYQLDVLRAGYYPVHRSVSITAGGVLRESVELTPVPAAAAPSAPGAVAGGQAPAASGSPTWLSWTLTGLATGAAVTTGVALAVRNQHASRWNSPACLESGRRRGEVCAAELDAGKSAERLAYGGGIASVLLAAGAVLSWTWWAPETPDAGLAWTGCSLTWRAGACSASF